MTTTTEIQSPNIIGTRTLEVDPGDGPVCLFLDGDFYRNRIGIPHTLGDLGLRAATLTGGSGEDRHRDYACASHFGPFVVEGVLPLIGGPVALLVGVSLSGLAVAHLAFEHPALFPRFVAQSPSAWWNEEALRGWVEAAGGSTVRAWLSVGTQENQTNVRHPPTGMHQKTSQWDSVHRLARAWGPTARLNPFEGGHEVEGWATEIGQAISWALGS